jgi:hypothetical protein
MPRILTTGISEWAIMTRVSEFRFSISPRELFCKRTGHVDRTHKMSNAGVYIVENKIYANMYY